MKYEEPLIERLPEPVREFVESYDEITVNEMPDELIRWGIHSPEKDLQFHIHEFSDNDGVETTLQIWLRDREVFGYIDNRTFMTQGVAQAPFMTGSPAGPVLRFELFGPNEGRNFGLALDTDNRPVIVDFGE